MEKEAKEKEENISDEKSINSVYDQFVNNISGLEAFFKTFAIKAIEQDKSIVEDRKTHFEKAILKSFGPEMLDEVMERNKDDSEELENEDESEEMIQEEDEKLDDENHEGNTFSKEQIENFLYELSKSPKRLDKNYEILTNGTFIMLNNYFEYLFADLLTFHFTSNKQILEERNTSISLNELKNYTTIEEAYNDILFREVEKILLDMSFEEIKNYFKKLDISLSEKLIDWSVINEIRERRHIIVHNNSRVNQKYISRTEGMYDFKVGDIVDVNPDYLWSSINEIKLAGVVLIMNCWGKWSTDTSTEAIGELMELSYELLKSKQSESVVKLCCYIDQSIKARNDDEENYILRAKINHCIALKRLGLMDNLTSKLKGIRTGALSPIFKIAKHLLKNEHKEIIPLVGQAILVDDLLIDDYLAWPLFEDIREDEEYNKLVLDEFKKKSIQP